MFYVIDFGNLADFGFLYPNLGAFIAKTDDRANALDSLAADKAQLR